MRRFVDPEPELEEPEPYGTLSDDLPHGGMWSRPQPDDGRGLRCAEHDLPVDAH